MSPPRAAALHLPPPPQHRRPPLRSPARQRRPPACRRRRRVRRPRRRPIGAHCRPASQMIATLSALPALQAPLGLQPARPPIVRTHSRSCSSIRPQRRPPRRRRRAAPPPDLARSRPVAAAGLALRAQRALHMLPHLVLHVPPRSRAARRPSCPSRAPPVPPPPPPRRRPSRGTRPRRHARPARCTAPHSHAALAQPSVLKQHRPPAPAQRHPAPRLRAIRRWPWSPRDPSTWRDPAPSTWRPRPLAPRAPLARAAAGPPAPKRQVWQRLLPQHAPSAHQVAPPPLAPRHPQVPPRDHATCPRRAPLATWRPRSPTPRPRTRAPARRLAPALRLEPPVHQPLEPAARPHAPRLRSTAHDREPPRGPRASRWHAAPLRLSTATVALRRQPHWARTFVGRVDLDPPPPALSDTRQRRDKSQYSTVHSHRHPGGTP